MKDRQKNRRSNRSSGTRTSSGTESGVTTIQRLAPLTGGYPNALKEDSRHRRQATEVDKRIDKKKGSIEGDRPKEKENKIELRTHDTIRSINQPTNHTNSNKGSTHTTRSTDSIEEKKKGSAAVTDRTKEEQGSQE